VGELVSNSSSAYQLGMMMAKLAYKASRTGEALVYPKR
jgi:hypothetical protein